MVDETLLEELDSTKFLGMYLDKGLARMLMWIKFAQKSHQQYMHYVIWPSCVYFQF